MPSVALLPHARGGRPVFNVAGEPWLLAFGVQVVLRLVAWCRTARRRSSGGVRIGVEGGNAVESKDGDGAKEGPTPDGSAKVLAGVLFGCRRRGGRGTGADDACRVKRSDGCGGGSEGGCTSQRHADGGCGDHLRCDAGRCRINGDGRDQQAKALISVGMEATFASVLQQAPLESVPNFSQGSGQRDQFIFSRTDRRSKLNFSSNVASLTMLSFLAAP